MGRSGSKKGEIEGCRGEYRWVLQTCKNKYIKIDRKLTRREANGWRQISRQCSSVKGNETEIKANSMAGRRANRDHTEREADRKANRGDSRWKEGGKKRWRRGRIAQISCGAGLSNVKGKQRKEERLNQARN